MSVHRLAHIASAFVLAAILLVPIAVQSAPPSGGGGGNKVTVTAAEPPDAFQGEEIDVIVSGSGFDAGSTVGYLVAGTTDASQVDVISVQYISSTELKTRIRPKDNALPAEYDIEVRSSSGRKGKGTTLFRVKEAEVSCTGFEPKEPTIAYLTTEETSGGFATKDLYLSSDSGCDRYLLMDDVDERLFPSYDCINCTIWLRLATQNGKGVVTWANYDGSSRAMFGVLFDFDTAGNVTSQSVSPQLFYFSNDGLEPWGPDVRFNASSEVELAILERDPVAIDRWLVVYNLTTGTRTAVIAHGCVIPNDQGICLEASWPVFWAKNFDNLYFRVFDPDGDTLGLARVRKEDGAWTQPQVLMTYQGSIILESTSSNGELVYRYEEVSYNKRGRITGFRRAFAVIDDAACDSFVCSPYDGEDLAIEGTGKGDLILTPDGRARAFIPPSSAGSGGYVREYTEPYISEAGRTLIENVGDEYDTSY